jgi:hypothetical protein
MSAPKQLNPSDDSDESSDEWVVGGSPGLLQRVPNAIRMAAEQAGSRVSSSTPPIVIHLDSIESGYRLSATASSEGPPDGPLTTAELARLDGLRLRRLALEANEQPIQIDEGAVLRADSRGWLTAEVPEWVKVGDRIIVMVLVSTTFGVAGGALGAFAVGDAVLREAAKVAVSSVVTGVGVAAADEIVSRLRGPGPPSLRVR